MNRITSVAIKVSLAALCILVFGYTSWADDFIYANNYNFGGLDNIWQIDLTSGNIITNQYSVATGNGRGVVDVNNVLYITTANSGQVFAFNTSTSVLSTAFTVSGASGLASISYNGTNFWIGDYSGSNKAFLYSPSGTLLQTIALANCTGFCDGLTYIPLNGGELISNRADGFDQNSIYDIYSASNGALLQSAFIDTTSLASLGCNHTTGIAWDGTNYFVSCLDTGSLPNGTLAEYNASGTFLGLDNLSNSNSSVFNNNGLGAAMEGLSANFAVTIPTPEPGTLFMMGTGLLVLAFGRKWLLAHGRFSS